MKKRRTTDRSSRGRRSKVKRRRISAQIGRALQATAAWNYTGVILGSFYFIVAGVISFRYHKILDFGMESDFLFEYVPVARKIAEGALPVSGYRGPVYPILLAAANAVIGDYFKSGLLIGLIAAAVTLAISYALIRRLFKAEIALAVVLLMMASPYFFMYTYQLGTDILFGALVTASLYFLLAGAEMNWKRLSASAVLGALAYLTRYNGVFILAAPILILISNPWKLDWRRRFAAASLFAAIFFACITPWGLHCLKQKGSFFYSENHQNIAYEIYGQSRMSREEFFWKGNPFESMSMAALVTYDPPVFLSALARNLFNHTLETVQNLLGWPLGILALAGLVMLLRRRDPSRTAYLLLHVAFFLVLLPVHFEIRYPLFMLAGLLTLSVCGLFLWDLNVAKRFVHASVAVLAGLAIYAGWNSYEINSRQISSGPREVVAIADWFKANVPAEKRGVTVAARKPHVAYYMGIEYVPLPFVNSPDELIRKLKEQNVDYLYFGPMEFFMRPELKVLIDARRTWPGLKKIATSNDPSSVLYEIE